MRTWLLLLVLCLPACFAPPGPMEQLSQSAYEMNTAMRFGRIDVAMAHVADDARQSFMERHAKWGKTLRVVDVELAGLRLLSKDSAEVQLIVGWHRLDESIMRTSAVVQHWKQGDNGWELDDELRASGAPGIFDRRDAGEGKPREAADGFQPPPADVNTGLL